MKIFRNFNVSIPPLFNTFNSIFRELLLLFCVGLMSVSCSGGTNSAGSLPGSDQPEGRILDEAPPHITEFILGTGDELAIRVWGHEDLNKKVKLDVSGEFYYPFLGYIRAGGVDIKELRRTVQDGLARYYVNPQVGVEVISLRSQKIFVLGEVEKPGVFVLNSATSAVEAIAKAGGFTNDGNKSSVILIRGDIDDPYLERLDLQDFLVKGSGGENINLEAGDVLYVPRSFVGDIRDFFKTLQIVVRPVLQLERGIAIEPRVEDVFLE